MNNTRWSQVVGKDVQGKNSEEVIGLAGLDWKVAQSPVCFEGGSGMKVDDFHLMNYRADNDFPLGIVGPGYHILQNSKMFNFLDGVVGSMESIYTNAGCFKGGRKVYIQAKLPGYIHFDDGDDIGEKFLTFISSHDGSMGIRTLFTPVRIVCQNTIVSALKNGINQTSVKHTVSMPMNLKAAKNALHLVNGQVSMLETISRRLAKVPFNNDKVKRLLEEVGVISDEEKKSTRANNVMDMVLTLFHHGKGTEFKSSRETAWGAFNAVTEYVDHYKGSDIEKRAESSLIGWGAKVKTKTLDLLAA